MNRSRGRAASVAAAIYEEDRTVLAASAPIATAKSLNQTIYCYQVTENPVRINVQTDFPRVSAESLVWSGGYPVPKTMHKFVIHPEEPGKYR